MAAHKLLLDTNVIIWMFEASNRLGPEATRRLEDSAIALAVSYFSLYEMVLKAAKGKLVYHDAIHDELVAMGVELLMPDREALRTFKIFNPDNLDPVDNMLLAVAMTEGCDLMTSDRLILETKVAGVTILDSRR